MRKNSEEFLKARFVIIKNFNSHSKVHNEPFCLTDQPPKPLKTLCNLSIKVFIEESELLKECCQFCTSVFIKIESSNFPNKI